MNETWFKTQKDQFEASSLELRGRSKLFALLRTLCFVLLVLTVLVSIYYRLMDVLIIGSIWWLVIFALLVKRHNRFARKFLNITL